MQSETYTPEPRRSLKSQAVARRLDPVQRSKKRRKKLWAARRADTVRLKKKPRGLRGNQLTLIEQAVEEMSGQPALMLDYSRLIISMGLLPRSRRVKKMPRVTDETAFRFSHLQPMEDDEIPASEEDYQQEGYQEELNDEGDAMPKLYESYEDDEDDDYPEDDDIEDDELPMVDEGLEEEEYTEEEIEHASNVLQVQLQALDYIRQQHGSIIGSLALNHSNVYEIDHSYSGHGMEASIHHLTEEPDGWRYWFDINPSFSLVIDNTTNEPKSLTMEHGSTDWIKDDTDANTSVRKNSVTRWKPGKITLFGTDTVVGKEMVAERITQEHFRGMKSGEDAKQDWMMGQLKASGTAKKKNYIKGHLMNDNLGGPAIPMNLYPITGLANSKHNKWVEQWIKREVKSGYVMYYKVEVTGETLTPGTVQYNKVAGKDRYPSSRTKGADVKANFKCTSARYKADGTRQNEVTLTIPSEYNVDTDKADTDITHLPNRYKDFKQQSRAVHHSKALDDGSLKYKKTGYSDDNSGTIDDYDNNVTTTKV